MAAQAPDLLWTKTYGGSSGQSVQQTSDGGFIIAGYNGANNSDFLLIKTDTFGDTLWTKTYGGVNEDRSRSVQQTSDGGYIIAGHTFSYGAGNADFWLVKTDASGSTVWEKTFGGINEDHAFSVQQTSDGGYIVAGYTFSGSATLIDVLLIKTDAAGNTVWTRTIGGSGYEYAYSVQQTSDGGYIITGLSLGGVLLIKTDASGNEVWTNTFGGSGADIGRSVQQTSDGGYIIAGYTDSYGAGAEDVWLIKTDAAGNDVWNKTFGGSNDEEGNSVQQTSDGGYIVAGYTASYGAGNWDIWLIKTDASGDTLWTKTFGGIAEDGSHSVQQTSDGGYIITGYTDSFGGIWLLRLGDKPPPVAASGLTATTGDQQIDLHWNPNSEADFLRYRIYGGTASGPTTIIDSTAGGKLNDTTATISGLTNGTTYYYRITAVDSSGNESAYSNEVSGTPVGLVAYYPFNGNANDESANSNDGTVIGAVPTADRFGNADRAYIFDGVDDNIYWPVSTNPMIGLNSITLAFWFYYDQLTGSGGRLVSVGNNDWFDLGPSFSDGEAGAIPDGTLNWHHTNLKPWVGVGAIQFAKWNYVVITATSNYINAYIDGVETYNDPNGWDHTIDGLLRIGGRYNNTEFLSSTIDDIRIYNRALTAAEIDSLYRLGGWPPPNTPTNLTAVAGDGQVDLHWNPNGEADFLKYYIYGGTAAAPTTLVDSTAGGNLNDTTATLIGLTNGTTYYYRITAVDSAKNGSEYSNEVSATPPIFTRVTTGPVATDVGSSSSVSWTDYDNDGNLDIFIANDLGGDNFLYANNGDGTFNKITTGPVVTDGGASIGNTWGDFDNDGDVDLFVTNRNDENNYLYTNDGDGTFTKATAGPLVSDGGESRGQSWGDYDGDGFLDLFVVNTLTQANDLYHNEGDGSFTKITLGAVTTDIGDSYGCSWIDYDNDGDLDLFVANGGVVGSQNNYLYRNDGAGLFVKITDVVITNDGRATNGGSWGDYDNDGDFDLFVTNYLNQNNSLYENNGDGTFVEITVGSIVTDQGWAQGSSWGDYDNDGYIDLIVANNGVNNFLYHNNGDGSFSRIDTEPISTYDSGGNFGVGWGDYDNDGDLDLFIADAQAGDANHLFINNGNSNSWIEFRLVGIQSNSSAIGAKVRVKAPIDGANPIWQIREISSQTGYLSQNSLDAHFGLGTANIVDSILIEWPSGIAQVFVNVATDQFLIITEPDVTPPAAPSGLIATAGDQQLSLAWSSNTEGDFLKYYVYGGTATAPTTKVDSTTGGLNDTTATITGLSNGVTYFYRITAVDSSGNESAYSGEVSATPVGLVAYYPFNGNANDESGNGNNGTVLGAALTADRFGNASSAYSFDGVDDYIEISDASIYDFGTGDFTISTWVLTATTTSDRIVAKAHVDNNDGYEFGVSRVVRFYLIDSDPVAESNLAVNDSVWHHIVGIRKGDTLKVYVDGIWDDTTTGVGSYDVSSNNTLKLGRRDGSLPAYYRGIADDIRLYNRALTAAEIAALYDEGGWLGSAEQIVSGGGEVAFPEQGLTLNLSGQSGADTLSVTGIAAAPDGNLPTGVALAGGRFWIIDHKGAGGFTVDLTCTLDPGTFTDDELAVPGNLLLLRRDDYGQPWIAILSAAAATDSTATFEGLTGFSQFTVARATITDIQGPLAGTVAYSANPTDGQPISITASISDPAGVQEADLFYLKGGQTSFSQEVMTLQSGTTWGADFPGTAATPAGILYYIGMIDSLGNRSRSDTSSIPVAYASGAITTAMANSAFPGGFPYDAWRLISLPSDIDNKSLLSTIQDELGGAPSDSTWQLFRYTGTGSTGYQAATSFVNGVAYFLKQGTVEVAPVFSLGSGKSYDLTGFSFVLESEKWSFISAPYPFLVPVSANQTTFTGPYTYGAFGSGGQEGWSLGSVQTAFQPWGGYIIYNSTTQSQTLMLDPMNLSKSIVAKSVDEPAEGWSLSLTIEGSKYFDNGNVIGRRVGALSDLDPYDRPEPPHTTHYISMIVDREDWADATPRTSDIRSLDEPNGVWDWSIHVKGEEGPLTVTYELRGEDLPVIAIFDPQTRSLLELIAPEQTLTINEYTERFPYRLTVIAGDADYVAETVDEFLTQLPKQFALGPNYPNPFNPTTTIEYSTPKPAAISLAVYNLLGQQVTVLVDEWVDMGHHRVTWGGRDDSGRPVASGVYFAILRASGKMYSQKMVLLK